MATEGLPCENAPSTIAEPSTPFFEVVTVTSVKSCVSPRTGSASTASTATTMVSATRIAPCLVRATRIPPRVSEK